MNLIEETIDATLDNSGELALTHPPQLPPGPVRVTIRQASTSPKPGLADVAREIAREQRTRGFPGRAASELLAEDQARLGEDDSRDQELDTARSGSTVGGP